MARAAHYPLRARELRQTHRAASVQLLGRDADFGAEPELAPIREARGGIDHDDRRVDLGEKAFGFREVVREDRLGVMRRIRADVLERSIEVVDDPHRDVERHVLGRPVFLGRGHGIREERASAVVGMDDDTGRAQTCEHGRQQAWRG